MVVVCSKEILLNNINIVSKAVASKTTQEILECILLCADTDGFRLISYNLELGIKTANIDAVIEEPGNVAIDAKLFSEIIRSLPENSVRLEVDNKNMTVIKCGKTEFKIMGQPAEQFPELPIVEKNVKYETSALAVKNMIKQTIFSVSVEDTKPILTGELLEINGNDFNIVAIDGFRVSFRNLKSDQSIGNIGCVVPAKSLNEISKILPDKEDAVLNIYFTENHALFEMDSCIIVSRLLEGEFLNYRQIFMTECNTSVIVDRNLFLSALERSTLVSKEVKKTPVKLKIDKTNIIITSNTELGESYDEVYAEIDGEGLNIAFNPKYLIDAIKVIEDDNINIQFVSPLSPCIIKGIDSESYKYLILPLRLKE